MEHKIESYSTLDQEFKDLIEIVKRDGKEKTTPRDIIQKYNGAKKRGSKLVREIELILDILNIYTDPSFSDDYIKPDDEIELSFNKSVIKSKFHNFIYEVQTKREITTTPKELLNAFDGSQRRTPQKVDEISFLFKTFGIEFDDLYNSEITLTSNEERIETIPETKIEVPDNDQDESNIYASARGEMLVSTEIRDTIDIKPYQQKSMEELTRKMGNDANRSVAGLLVLPTGAGKTTVVARWLLNKAIEKNVKVLWLAHRHELIDQAANTFAQNVGIVKTKKNILIRKISGLKNHDMPKHISGKEDIIIASVPTLARSESNLKYLDVFLKSNKSDKFFLIIDEAHHSVAKTYRKIINHVRSFKNLRILGLTATPFRTLEKKLGGLSTIFKDQIIHKEDLQDLILQGYLSKPIHNSVPTNFNIEREIDFNDEKIQKYIERFKELPEKIITSLAENAVRRRCVIDTYLKEKEKWGKTIIFALNQHDAIAINELLNDHSVKSEYVISGLIQRNLQPVSNIENKKKIVKFKNGLLDVLVNVNILTEGFDDPSIQTVFLTRPTKSKTMMTQMVGRGMRGPKMGGTPTVNLVSFVDNWENLVGWITPKELLPPSEIEDQTANIIERKIPYFIPEKLIQDYARFIFDKTDDLKNLEFIKRIPVGWYGFELIYLDRNDDENNQEQDIAPTYVLVYENQLESYGRFIENLDKYNKFISNSDGIDLSDEDLNKFKELSFDISKEFFSDCGSPIPINENIINIVKYNMQTGNNPEYFTFEERDKFDIDKIASYLIDNEVPLGKVYQYIKEQFEIPMWKQLFNNNYDAFEKEVELAWKRKPGIVRDSNKSTQIIYEQKNSKDIPDIPYELRQKVLERDNYKCTKCGTTKYLQIDHIKPFSKGGHTVFENLQTLCKKHHIEKGETEKSYLI